MYIVTSFLSSSLFLAEGGVQKFNKLPRVVSLESATPGSEKPRGEKLERSGSVEWGGSGLTVTHGMS